jgi:hypothetical protein
MEANVFRAVPAAVPLCRFVPLCAALCRLVPLCAALCCFVPLISLNIDTLLIPARRHSFFVAMIFFK